MSKLLQPFKKIVALSALIYLILFPTKSHASFADLHRPVTRVHGLRPIIPAENFTEITGLSGAAGDALYYTVEVPAGATSITVSITGGSGDADLYVRYGEQPHTSSYDCRPYRFGNEETCTFVSPRAGIFYVMVHAYSAISGVTLRMSYQSPLPVVYTDPATGITGSSATLGGRVTSEGDGLGGVTERGIVYSSTHTSPSLNGTGSTKLSIGSGTGTFSSDAAGLVAGNTYYFRAFATSSIGTDYGRILTFSTTNATSNSPVCIGGSINLSSISVDGGQYAWSGPNGFTSMLQNPSIPHATAVNAGIYTLTISVNGQPRATESTTVAITDRPATPTPSSNSPVCTGSTINLTTPAVTGATYTWSGPAGFTSALKDPTITNATAANAGTYNVVASVNGCHSDAGSITVAVKSAPQLPVPRNNGPVSVGGIIYLAAEGVPGASYSWTGPNGYTSALQNPEIPNASVAMAGSYKLKITVDGCESVVATTNLAIRTEFPIIVSPSNGITLATANPSYSGRATSGSTVTVFVDGAAIGTTVTTTDGNWTLTQPVALSQGSHTVYATAISAGAEVSENSATNSFMVDTVKPAVALSSQSGISGSTTAIKPFVFTATFSEAISGFDISKINVANGMAAAPVGSGHTYTFTVEPITAGTATTVALAADVVIDEAGNGNVSSATYILTYQTPTPVISAGPVPALTASYGAPSAAPAEVSITSTNLNTDITVTAPQYFQVSADNTSFASTAILARNVPRTLYVRLGGNVPAGKYSGSIQFESNGATITDAAIPQSSVLQRTVIPTVSNNPAITKAYDKGRTANLAAGNYALTDIVPGDEVSVNGTATYEDPNVGAGKTITVGNFVLSGANSGNYLVQDITLTTSGTITKKALTLALNGTPEITKTYDQGNEAILVAGNYMLTGVENGDDVGVSGTASYANSNAGTGKTVTAGSFSLSGASGANYSLATSTASTTGSITQKPLTLALNSAPAITKVYDQTNTANLVAGNYTLSGVLPGDDVSASGIATYDNSIVGEGKTITASSLSISGAASPNYSLPNATASTTGTITQRALTLALNSMPAITKVYDQGNTAYLSPGNYALSGVLQGDDVSASGVATYDNANVGTSKTITAGSFVLSGNASANYRVPNTPLSTTGAITKKLLTLVLNNVPLITKVYDKTTVATLSSANFTLIGAESNDVVTVSGKAAYADANVGTNKAVSVGDLSLAGPAGANYSLPTTAFSTTGSITARPITAVLQATPTITKAYDGKPTASLAAGNYAMTGIQTGDTVMVSGAASYDSALAGSGKTLTVANLSLNGRDKNNYSLINSSATTTGEISPAMLTVAADNKTKIFGTANPVLTASYIGFVNGENSTVLTVQPTLATTAVTLSAAGSYPISASAAAAPNYTISYVPGSLVVEARTITLTASAGTKVYGASDPILNYTYSGTLVANDTFSGSLTRASGENVGNYSISQGTLGLSSNYRVNYTGANLAISKAVLTITADNRVLCQGSNLPAFSVSYSGFKFADGESSLSTKPNVSTTASSSSPAGNYALTPNGAVSDNYSFVYQNGQLAISAPPAVAISSNSGFSVSKGATVQLTATGGTSYSWSNASGIISGQATALLTVRPSKTTTYAVTATNANGCTQSTSVTIEVAEDYMTVSGTNILTPNGDGRNDFLVIRNIDMYPNNEIKVFDIAGRMVYSKKSYDNSWNGTFNGSPLAKGTYYYLIDFGDGKAKRKGFVSIVRD